MFTRFLLFFAIATIITAISDLPASPLITRKLSGEQTAIGGAVSEVRISPDGEYAVYRGDMIAEDVQELFSVRLSGGAPAKISSGQNLSIYGIPFIHVSPDSQWVYFHTFRGIYRTPIDGSVPPSLAHTELGYFSTDSENWNSRNAYSPKLSRDGRYLYFHAAVYDHYDIPHELYRTDLFRIDLIEHNLAENITVGTPASKEHIYRYEVSDNSRVLLAHTLVSGGEFRTANLIYHIDLTNGSTTLLPTPDYVEFVKLSPPGSHLLIKWRDEIGGSSLRQFPPFPDPEIIISEAPQSYYDSEYSPDGMWIIIRTGSGLFKRRVSGGDLTLIAPDATVRFFGAEGRLVFSAVTVVGDETVNQLYSVRLDGDIPPIRLCPQPLAVGGVERSPDGRSALLFEQLPGADGAPQHRLVIVRIDGSTPPQQLSDPDLELPKYPLYKSATFTGSSDRVIYTKGLIHYNDAAIYTVIPGSPPELVAQTQADMAPHSYPWPIPNNSDTERVVYLQDGKLFASGQYGSEPATQISVSTTIGADVSAVELTTDGDQAVFLLDADKVGRTELFSVSTDGGGRRRMSHPLANEPDEESVKDFWMSPSGQVIYSTSHWRTYSVQVGDDTPPHLIEGGFEPIESNADGRYLLGISNRILTTIDLSDKTIATTQADDGVVATSRTDSGVVYSLKSTADRAIYITRWLRGDDTLMSWPLDGSAPATDLAPGKCVRNFAVANATGRVIYQTDSGAIFSVSTTGGNQLELVESGRLDDRLQLFATTADGQWLIYRAGLTFLKIPTSLRGETIELSDTLTPDQYIVATAFSADGKILAYAAETYPEGLAVYSIELDGTDAPQEIYSSDALNWFSTKLISAGNRFLLFANVADYDLKLLSLPDSSSSPATVLNSSDHERTTPIEEDLVLSADNSRIVFIEQSLGEDGRYRRALMSAPTDGSERGTRIGTTLPEKFTTNSDGSVIAYISNRENPTIDELFVAKLNPDPSSYDGWLFENFSPAELAAPEREVDLWHRNADPDADGIENWLERLTALDPSEAQGVAPYELILDADANSYLQFRSAKNLSPVPTVECSEDLTDWQTTTKSLRTISDQGDAWLLETEIDGGESDRIYVRLRE